MATRPPPRRFQRTTSWRTAIRAIREHEHAVLQAIRDTAYGTIEVTVHQSRIVQITRSEKLRL